MHNHSELLPKTWLEAMKSKLYSLFVDFPSHMGWNYTYLRDQTELCAKRNFSFSQAKSSNQAACTVEYNDAPDSLAVGLKKYLSQSSKKIMDIPLDTYYNEISIAVQRLYEAISAAKIRKLKTKNAMSQESIKTQAASVRFPAGCLFPSLDQMSIRLPQGNPEFYNPLPENPVYIRAQAPLAAKCFDSKDAPCLLQFELEGSTPRCIIFKILANSLPESMISSFLENTFFRDDLGEVPEIDESFDMMYPGLQARLPMYRVTPLLMDLVAVEVMERCKSLKEFKDFTGFSARKIDGQPNVSEYLRQNWNKYFSTIKFYDYSDRMINSCVSHAFCSTMHMVLGLGDRNFSNIMISDQLMLINIDFELIMGSGKNLPVPEIAPLRLGPYFQMITGSIFTKGLFRSVMTVYARKIVGDDMPSMPPHFFEVAAHKNQKFFLPLDEERVVKFFDFLIQTMAGNAVNLVAHTISISNDPSIKRKMFVGMEPTL